MPPEQTPHSISCIIYTDGQVIIGEVRSLHWRLSDALNSLTQNYLMMFNVRRKTLGRGPEDEEQLARYLVRVDAIVLALPTEAQEQVDLLNRQLLALRQQLARIQTALDVSEAKSKEQQVQIVDLGRRLNLALAGALVMYDRVLSLGGYPVRPTRPGGAPMPMTKTVFGPPRYGRNKGKRPAKPRGPAKGE